MNCMVCEHPTWGFIECYREVTGLEHEMLARLCDTHKPRIIALDILSDDEKEVKVEHINKPKPKDCV